MIFYGRMLFCSNLFITTEGKFHETSQLLSPVQCHLGAHQHGWYCVPGQYQPRPDQVWRRADPLCRPDHVPHASGIYRRCADLHRPDAARRRPQRRTRVRRWLAHQKGSIQWN